MGMPASESLSESHNMLSHSPGNRDKSPVRSRTRGRNSPVVVEQQEESQENKRKTRSAKSKGNRTCSLGDLEWIGG